MKIKKTIMASWIATCSALLFVASTSQAQTIVTYVVDDFSPAGVSSSNPTNYDYYSSDQNYASGQIRRSMVELVSAARLSPMDGTPPVTPATTRVPVR